MVNLEPAEQFRPVAIQNVLLHVAKECNLQCKYCYFSASRPLPDEMRTQDFVQLWPDLIAIRPQKVVFTGGEPPLRPDILTLLRSLRDADPDHQIMRCLSSNGHLVTRELAKQLVGEGRVSRGLGFRECSMLREIVKLDAHLTADKVVFRIACNPDEHGTDRSECTLSCASRR